MQTLQGNLVNLRALEPEDLLFLKEIENDEKNWEISNTQTPFSLFLLKNYIENSHLDIYTTKQLRLVIEKSSTKEAIGLIDLFDFNPQHHRAGIGIIIKPDFQNNGYANQSLQLLIRYAFKHLNIHQLFANVIVDNLNSLRLFEKNNFVKIGVKKDWIFSNNSYKDEVIYQLINK